MIKISIHFIFITDIWEAGRSSSAFAELAGRTHVMPSDVVLALVEMGK